MERKRIVHQLDTPFSTVQWPVISQEDQDSILELLCSLLSPLGHYRREHIQPSKGKRKRDSKSQAEKEEQSAKAVPPPPELKDYVDIGLANITRSLQAASSTSADNAPATPYSVVFVARSGHPSAFHSHFPQMVAVASKTSGLRDPIRLVGFSKACEDRLGDCLGIPRVSSVAIRSDAPRAQAVVHFVREHVPPVEVAWLKETQKGQHLETKINAVETAIGPKKQKKEVLSSREMSVACD